MILERFSLKGKTAPVTGSSRGLGAGIAIALAEAGANVAIHGLRTAPENTRQMLSKIGANHFAVVGDVSDAAACSLLIEQVVHHFAPSTFSSTTPESFGVRPPSNTPTKTGRQ